MPPLMTKYQGLSMEDRLTLSCSPTCKKTEMKCINLRMTPGDLNMEIKVDTKMLKTMMVLIFSSLKIQHNTNIITITLLIRGKV